jgi:hypothetical protein
MRGAGNPYHGPLLGWAVVTVSVALTERDLAVLTWLGEMFGAPLPVVRDLLVRAGAPTESAPGAGWRQAGEVPDALAVARKWAGRMVAAKLVTRSRPLGATWVAPTRAGLDFAGLDYGTWKPVGWKLEHVAAVGRLRLKLEAQYPEATWTSERAIRSRWAGSGARVRYADGQLDFPGTTCVGVEVELHRKKHAEYEGIGQDIDPAFDQVWWFVPAPRGNHGAEVVWLRGVLAGILKPGRPEHHVIPLTGELAGVLR